ncbi:hypothetical protein STEG23_009040, partial [Scotinomys teguina]
RLDTLTPPTPPVMGYVCLSVLIPKPPPAESSCKFLDSICHPRASDSSFRLLPHSDHDFHQVFDVCCPS